MISMIIGLVIGCIATYSAYRILAPVKSDQATTPTSNDPKPLYWVAPMDAEYKRDKPGKSPMGMDLVPVYANGKDRSDEGVGTIRVSPDVINNLGVRTVTVNYDFLETQINTVGYVTYNEDKFVNINPRVEGWVEKLYFKAVGEAVQKGQPLYEIYSPELVNAQEEFLLALDRKNSQLINAAQNRLQALQLSESSIYQLKKTRKVQQKITFYAPQNGVIESLNIREGFFVKPETSILSILDLSEVWVKAEVFERQSAQLSMGDNVVMTLDYLPAQEWYGKIEHIHPMLAPKTRTAIVRVRFDNKNGELKPNMFAKIAIQTTSGNRALLVPKQALIRTGHQNRVVLALGDGRFKSIAVTVGRFDNKSVEILAGLNEGDEVVSSAQFLLDSESSKTSDLKRMSHDDSHTEIQADSPVMNQMDLPQNSAANSTQVSTPSSATVTGTINSLMIDHGMINISRAAIEKWNRPAATIDFMTANGVSLAGFSQGDEVIFTFEVHEDNFVIVEISHLKDAKPSVSVPASDTPIVEHSNNNSNH